MTNEKLPAPPRDLSKESAKWWSEVVAEYEMASHHLRLLTLAARAWDRAESAREALRNNGLTYRDRHGVLRPRPEAVIERQAMVAFARLLRELRLDGAPEPDVRLPRIGGGRR